MQGIANADSSPELSTPLPAKRKSSFNAYSGMVIFSHEVKPIEDQIYITCITLLQSRKHFALLPIIYSAEK